MFCWYVIEILIYCFYYILSAMNSSLHARNNMRWWSPSLSWMARSAVRRSLDKGAEVHKTQLSVQAISEQIHKSKITQSYGKYHVHSRSTCSMHKDLKRMSNNPLRKRHTNFSYNLLHINSLYKNIKMYN